jgi:hypothetical protein
MKVRDLKDWPPQPSAFGKSYVVPTAEEAIVERVVNVHGKRITFIGTAKEIKHTYHFEAPNEEVALDLRRILELNVGNSVLSVGDAELSVD